MIPKHQNNYKLVNGTSLRGYVKCDYKTLIETFGEPDHECDGYKIDRQWVLKFGDGTVATIYNYKKGEYNFVLDLSRALKDDMAHNMATTWPTTWPKHEKRHNTDMSSRKERIRETKHTKVQSS